MDNDPFVTGPSRTHMTGGPKGRYGSSEEGSKAVLFFLPWLVFGTIVFLFAFLYHHHMAVVWTIVAITTATALLVLFTGGQESRWSLYFGILVLIAVSFAVCSGYYNYEMHMRPFFSASENRAYQNVLPQEPAASHADAGAIEFAEEARIDTFKVVGYKQGSVYCVAPIMDQSMTSRVEYWAVGVDCCGARGNFQCWDATESTARGGIVLATPDDMYMKAVNQAEAAYDLVSSDDPLFIQWVVNPQKVQEEMYTTGLYLTGALCVLHFIINAVLTGLTSMVSKPSQPRLDRSYRGEV